MQLMDKRVNVPSSRSTSLSRTTPSQPLRSKVVSRTATLTPPTLAPSDVRTLGQSDVRVPVIGIGTWQWGDKWGFWGYDNEYSKRECEKAYEASVRTGLTFIDTAEVYGFGLSEQIIRECMQRAGHKDPADVQIATKYFPLPWRVAPSTVTEACKDSLSRLGLPKVSLYQQHWPGFGPQSFLTDAYVDGMADCKLQGLCDAVGVSNFNTQRTQSAVKRMKSKGVSLDTNQVMYSMLYREPERNGLLETCKENGVTLIAYSPLALGLLSGKYTPGGITPFGPRAALFDYDRREKVQPLVDLLNAIGKERNKTPIQVALNWTVCKGALPIPGVKTVRQAEECAGALGWRLNDGEIAELDKVSAACPQIPGAPLEAI
ncbi:NADP-dependent oxidoreductase domain-containing protein [Dunaliella salina]|uniref:NADP-dependent oxidoreductase domain-containing protein n=1 Tax=Dunaliella salina TaxID=3046 RepID=A0ABQ7GK67_DUNSA|nr:NADP-dependent oxidoreductase domain-containing protein [Dunaliella salina]|eukprot:KAF5834908.1 NADP-dependent oxidoreductase domain-containing protein [Dunaliella salina]